MSSLEKDCQDLQSTIDALQEEFGCIERREEVMVAMSLVQNQQKFTISQFQKSNHFLAVVFWCDGDGIEKGRGDGGNGGVALLEEKKLLQSKLRKASTSAKSIDVSNSPLNKRDMSTSTEDLDASIDERHETASSLESDASNVALLPENGQSTLEFSSVNIPSDQMRMIQNINALISELALEKEELMQALTSESSHCSKLKELNKELSRKLEAQTQRLELLTAQSMANENTPARQPDSRIMHENTPYADEGDEVVERVLGWIMKLFPGGPSRRRTSKLL
uniref:Uncharacterized protein n=1 Tax=Fagus sylvatica TaxID=28930 RepID=A0A2N9I2R2_FAGSY